MKLIIQIPCFNEEKTLPQVIEDLPREIDGIDQVEYLVIDDGSSDSTVQVARDLGVHHILTLGTNRGLAYAFYSGINHCLENGADIVVNTDGDNQYQGQDFGIFQNEFDSLLDISIALANTAERVFVVSIPDYGVTPFGSSNSEIIGQQLDMYNAYMAEQCAALDIPFINITEISRELGASPGALAPDNLHPSGAQYSEWVGAILPVVLSECINE